MQEPEVTALSPDGPFQFGCDPGVVCFNQCCRDLNQALTPFDVLQLRTHLNLSWEQFLARFATLYAGPASGLPVVSLRFSASRERRCPFVMPRGCSVYPVRPTSCRLYPVARALQRSRTDESIGEHFALLNESHCRGFEKGPMQTVRDWIRSQGAEEGLAANDRLMELIALKNRLRPGPLAPEQRQSVAMAFYDLDTLKTKAAAGQLPTMVPEHLLPLPDANDDAGWLAWGLVWIRRALFGGGGA